MSDLQLSCVLKFSKQVDVWEDDDGFSELEPLSCRGFFKHFGATVVLDEFWGDNEGQKFAPRFVGYNITVTLQGQYSYIRRAIEATLLFFDLNDAVKIDENLQLV